VQPIFFFPYVKPACSRYYVIYVVLPEPVSPITINILFSIIASNKSFLKEYIGKLYAASFKDIFDLYEKV